jgi:hypothetical protein
MNHIIISNDPEIELMDSDEIRLNLIELLDMAKEKGWDNPIIKLSFYDDYYDGLSFQGIYLEQD